MSIDCRNLCYSISTATGDIRLLDNINVHINKGDMVALMGPSGAGKSTFLDLVAGRRRYGTVSGRLAVNGLFPDQTSRSQIAYVLQDDVHISCLTVRETVSYAVQLRCGLRRGSREELERVDRLLHMLDLKNCADVIVGSSLEKGISGGQLRRLSIAVEIVLLPQLICLDEPTSGLDSTTALEVVRLLKTFSIGSHSGGNESVSSPCTILCTIHQPSPQQFTLFDRLILFAPGGVLIYEGSIEDALRHFNAPPLSLEYKEDENPAEYLLEISCGRRAPAGSRVPLPLEVLVEACNQSESIRQRRRTDIQAVETGEKIQQVGWMEAARILMHREWRSTLLQLEYMLSGLSGQVVSALLIGVIFLQRGVDVTGEDVVTKSGDVSDDSFNTLSAIFFVLLFAVLGNIEAVPEVFVGKVLYLREREAGTYSALSYWAAVAIGRTPVMLIKALIFCGILYPMIGLRQDFYAFLVFFSLVLLTSWVGMSYAQALGAFFSTPMLALGMYPPTFTFLSMFAGFAIRFSKLPVWWKSWAIWASYVRWAYEGLVKNEFNAYDGHEDVYSFYDFDNDDVNAGSSAVVLFGWVVLLNVFFYWALLPPASRLSLVEESPQVGDEEGGRTMMAPLVSTSRGSEAVVDHRVSRVFSHEFGRTSFMESPNSTSPPGAMANMIRTVDQSSHMKLRISSSDKSADRVPTMYWDSLTAVHSRSARDRLGDWSSPFPAGMQSRIRYDIQELRMGGGEGAPILKDVSGCIASGEVVAIMGPSGAGKTTLLDLLSGRIQGSVDPSVKDGCFINGSVTYEFERQDGFCDPRENIAYVTQGSSHNPSLTCRDTFQFAAAMRMSPSATKQQREQRISLLLEALELTGVVDVAVGGVGSEVRGLSGGQRKRLSIGVEIINLPDILFLDECTTGLDSSTSYELLCCLKKLAVKNRTVVSTIHLPSADIFSLFDRLILLSSGRVLYNGSAQLAMQFFLDMGCYPISHIEGAGVNPADFLIDVASCKANGRSGVGYYPSALLADKVASESKPQSPDLMGIGVFTPYPLEFEISQTNWQGYAVDVRVAWLLARRYWLKAYREGKEVQAGIERHIVNAIFYGSVFWRLDTDDELSRASVLFFTTVFLVMNNEQHIPGIFADKPLRDLEVKSKVYSPGTYWLGLVISTTPLTLLYCFIFACFLYPLSDLRHGFLHFAQYVLFSSFGSVAGLYLCQYLAASNPSPPVAIAKYPPLAFFMLGFAGYLVKLDTLDDYLKVWAPNISFVRWVYQAQFLNEFSGTSDSNDLIEEYNFQHETRWECFAIVCGMLCFFTVLSLRALAT